MWNVQRQRAVNFAIVAASSQHLGGTDIIQASHCLAHKNSRTFQNPQKVFQEFCRSPYKDKQQLGLHLHIECDSTIHRGRLITSCQCQEIP